MGSGKASACTSFKGMRTTIYWVRRDLRLADNPALMAAVAEGAVVPVFILDPETEALGAAPKWRLGLGIEAFARALESLGRNVLSKRKH